MKVVGLAVTVGACLLPAMRASDEVYQAYPYAAWSAPIKAGTCSSNTVAMEIKIPAKTGDTMGTITCAMQNGTRTYRLQAGMFEIGEQMLIPERTAIIGAGNPNDMSEPTKSPNWKEQTLFLATRGATNYLMKYCHAKDMVTTRVGFVLSSYVTVRDVSYQGIDTIRPEDNGALCGGGVFETKGCAENDCRTGVNNGGSDGIGSVQVVIENVRLNDYYFAEDAALVGASIEGNYQCNAKNFRNRCCFCKPNSIRSSQVGVWVPQTRNAEGTSHLFVNNVVSSSNQGDGVNLHGKVDQAVVQNLYFQNTGDDVFALWGGVLNPTSIIFKDAVAVNPGILRPNWYGNCVATYGLQSVVFENLTCKVPTLKHPIPAPESGELRMATSMFVFYNSFGAGYPEGNSINIKGWTFEDLEGNSYTPSNGCMDKPEPEKMVWTRSSNGIVAPFYFISDQWKINVIASKTHEEHSR